MNTSSKNTPQQYNIEIVFQQDTYDFAAAYSGLIFSLLSTDFSTEKSTQFLIYIKLILMIWSVI